MQFLIQALLASRSLQDEAEEQQRLKKERNADAAAAAAFAKVEPMLKISNVKTSSKPETAEAPTVTPPPSSAAV